MGLMGFGKSLVEGVVALRYEANVDQAKAAIKGLSGEQKKAAKEAAESYKQQNEAFQKHVADFGKGAAIIGSALLVAKTSWTAYRDEAKLSAGAAGVSIDKLSESYGGLKTRMELLTLAQAGHQGAWKLTTGQIQQVIEGMRALEKKGYDSQQVFEKFTDVIKKGKVEGLDDFGISLKATGDKSQDLKVLLNALRGEVRDVGGDFSQAGDDMVRASVRMEDGITRVRIALGKAIDEGQRFVEAAARWAGKQVFGDQPTSAADDQVNAYARALQNRRGITISGARSNSAAYDVATGGFGTAAKDYLGVTDYQLFGGPSAADEAGARALAAFRGSVRRGMAGSGPLAAASPAEFEKAMLGLPKDWEQVDAGLAKMVDNLRESSKSKWMLSMYKWGLSAKEAAKAGATPRGRGGGGRGRAEDVGPGLIFGAARGAFGALSAAADYENAQNDAAARSQADALAAYQDRMSQRFADAQLVQDIEAGRSAMAKQQEESFLERTFGKLEEFDAYAAGFATLKTAVTDGFAAWISGSESLGTAIKKSIATSLAAYAVEMSGKAIVAGAEALFFLAKGQFASAGAMAWSATKYAAAAGILGGMAKGLGGSGGGGGGAAASAAGVPGRSNAAPTPQSGVVIVGDPLSDDSPRERARRVRRAMRSAGRDAEGVSYG